MKELNRSEKALKRFLKRKITITTALVVAFLISGIPYYDETDARDLRARVKEENVVRPVEGGPTMNESANGTDVVNIVKPNENGISHNKFTDLNVGAGNGLIFNNSTENGTSKIGGYVTKNSNLDKSATTILSEVTGNKASNINGSIEVFGGKADFILANENGINVNGASFINTSGVTLTTGKVTTNGSDINVDIQKGNVKLDGVGTSGDYFNVLAKTIELYKGITPIDGEKNPNINLIAGENKLGAKTGKLGEVQLLSSKNTKSDKYGIYASDLGAMYGRNIRLISTDDGLGVKHEGLIYSEKDIDIQSNGDVVVANINSNGSLKVSGNNLKTLGGSLTQDGKEYKNGVSAKGNVNIDLKGEAELNSTVQSTAGDISLKAAGLKLANKDSALSGENLNISAKNVENSGLISANKGLTLSGDNITNNEGGVIKGSTLDIQGTNSIVNKGDIRENRADLNEFVDPNGKVKIKVKFGGLENYGNIAGKDIDILTQKLVNSLNGKIVATDGNIVLTTTAGELLNEGEIFSNKKVNLISQENIKNMGRIGGDSLVVQAVKGQFLNAGHISAVKDLQIIVDSLVNAGDSKEIDKYLANFYQYSDAKLEQVNEILANLEKRMKTEGESEGLKSSYQAFKQMRDNLVVLKNELSKTGNLGVITASNVTINGSSNVENKGLITTEQGLDISGKNVTNSGVLQTQGELLLKAIENITNSGRATAQKGIKIDAKSFVSTGEGDKISSYLAKVKELNNEKIQELSKKIAELEVKLAQEKDKGNVEKLEVELKGYTEELNGLYKLRAEVTSFEGIGVLEGDNIVITTVDSLKNNGVVIAQKDLTLKSQGDISSLGVASVGNNFDVIGKSFENGNLTVGNEFKGKVQNGITSNNLTVGKGVSLEGNLKNTGKLAINGNLAVTGGVENTQGANGTVKGDINVSGELANSGNLSTGGNLTAGKDGNFTNKGDIEVGKDITINSKNVENNNLTVAGKTNIDTVGNIVNTGKLQSKDSINVKGSSFESNGEIVTEGEFKGEVTNDFKIKDTSVAKDYSVKAKNYENNSKVVVGKDIDINATEDITNNGMLVGNGNIKLDGKNIKNSDGTTIWATKNVVLNAVDKIYNGILSTIEGQGDVSLKAKEIENNGGRIKSGNNLDIRTNSLVNKSNVVEDVKIDGYTTVSAVTRWDQVAFYHLDTVTVEVPKIVDNSYVKDRATISSGGDISIKGYDEGGKADVLNHAGTIASSKNLDIVGDVKNTTHRKEISVEWLLANTKVTVSWETKLYGGAHGNGGVEYKGNLKEALEIGVFNKGNDKFYTSLTKIDNPVLQEALNTYLGPDWRTQNKPVSQDKWNKEANFEYVTANAGGKIFAGKDLNHSGGEFINDGGESGSNKDVEAIIGNETVVGTGSNGSVNIKDINQIKEVDGVKQIHDVEVITGEVTIDGVTIKAETGNTAGSIAVAGTINPIIFIETPTTNNGIFKPASPKPNGIQPIYETNIDFIDPNKFYGSDYFFKQIGYDKNKTSSVIGDAYYEYVLLTKAIQEGIGYKGNISAENIKALLDNALSLQHDLNLEVGKPLTPDQINRLNKDIVWYVEMEVNGQRTLVPQVYFSKESRINIAQNQGNGGNSTVNIGGNFTSDNTKFSNTNGNIVANGNIIIKSQGDITNNSSGGVSGGITSQTGNVAVDAGGDVNLIGGSLKGDNVLVSGNNVNIEATLGVDNKGNQVISDQGKITGENGIQIDAKNDVNVKGGNLTANGVEVKPEKKEDSMGGGIEESKPEEEVKVKDVKYYQDLFKKDSADIIEGDAGTINVNAGGDVNVKDVHTISSEIKQENINSLNYKNSVSAQAKSNGSTVVGSNVNINSEKSVNIQGSTIATNDALEANKGKDLIPGSVNISAKKDVNITDSKDVSFEKSNSLTTTVDNGLLTVKWSDKEKNSSLSKGSNIVTGGDLNISSGNDVNIKGSGITALGSADIDAKNDVNITDGRDVVTEKSTDGRFQILGGGVTDKDIYSSKSIGSGINSGELSVSAGNNIKVVNGNIASSEDTKFKAGNDISIEAGKNEYSEKTNTTNIGLFADANVGIGGVGVSGNASTSDMSASGEVSSEWGADSEIGEKLEGSNEKIPTTSGKPHMDQLINTEIGVKLENTRKEVNETTWSESQLQGKNISMSAGNTVDIGGGDYKAEEGIDIKGKKVDTTKYEDVKTEKTDGFTLTAKQSQGVNSAIVDTINTGVKMADAIKSGEANDGLLIAQGAGAATNLIFNDLAGVYSKQSVGVAIEKETAKETKENITSLEGKDIKITATDGDINLAGVDINGEENVSLDAKKNINITGAKETSTKDGYSVDLEGQLEETAGYSALWGGNTDIGVGGSASVDVDKEKSESYENSVIKSGGNISIKSGGDTNINGGEIEAKKDANVDVGGNLNIESKKSSYDEHSINANAGANVSIGAASNTIGKGEIGFNAGGGDIWKTGETVEQSGIKSGGNLNVTVKGDLNMTGGVLGSESESGKLDVGGNINLKDIVTTEKAGGAHLTISGGLEGDMGADGTIGDQKDKQVTSKSVIGLDSENINAGGNITVNGAETEKEDIYKDMENSQIVDRDINKKGGDLSITGSLQNIKEFKEKFHKNKDHSSSSHGNDGDVDVHRPDNDSNNRVDNNDKYAVLDKDNAFDFPKDDVIRDSFVDTANEPTIVPEKAEKLYGEPPAYKNPPAYAEAVKKKDGVAENVQKNNSENGDVNLHDKIENTVKEIGDLKSDINRVEKIEGITGGDLITKATIDDLSSKVSKKQEQLNDLIKNIDTDNSQFLDKIADGIQKNINGLLDKQKEISDKEKLNFRDKENLDRIEKQLKQSVEQMNTVTSKKEEVAKEDILNKYKDKVTDKQTNSDGELKETNIAKEINNEKYKTKYEELAKTEAKLQKERENLADLLKKQGEITAKENLSSKEKRELAKLEKDIKSSLDKINKHQDEQKKIIEDIDSIRRVDLTEDDIVYADVGGFQNKVKKDEVPRENTDYERVDDPIYESIGESSNYATVKDSNSDRVEVYSKGNTKENSESNQEIPKYDFKDKNIDQVIDKVQKELSKIQKEQQKLIVKSELDNSGQYALDKTVDSLKEALKDYIAKNKDKELTTNQKEKVEKILDKFEAYDRNNDKYLSGKPQEKENIGDKLTVITRSDKDIRDNLQKVAEYSDKIPKEHLLNYLDKVIKNSEFEATLDKPSSGGHETLVSNPSTIQHSEASEMAVNKIYDNVMKNTDNSIREKLDEKLLDRVLKDESLIQLIEKDGLDGKDIEQLANKIQDIKADIYEKEFGKKYDKVKIDVIEDHSNNEMVGSNDGERLKIYLQEGMDVEEVLGTIIHELTHQDQNNIKKGEIEEHKDLAKLYDLNTQKNGYISREGDEYFKQPIEKEAEKSEDVVQKIYDKLENSPGDDSGDEFDFSSDSTTLSEKFKNQQDKYAQLDKDNAFDLPQDNVERDSFVDKAGEGKIVAEHYTPLEGNPEKYREQNKSLAEKQEKLKKLEAEMQKEFLEAQNRLNNLENKILKEKQGIQEVGDKFAVLDKENAFDFPQAEKTSNEKVKELVDRQNELASKKEKTAKDREELESIESNLKKEFEKINSEIKQREELLKDTANESKIVADHYEPLKGEPSLKAKEEGDPNIKLVSSDNRNLQSPVQSEKLGDIPLIYGTSDGRGELTVEAAKSPNMNAHVADAYLGILNTGYNQIMNLAEKYVNGNLSIDDKLPLIAPIDYLENYQIDYHENQAVRVNEEANEELLNTLLNNQKVKDTLKNIAENSQKLKENPNDESAKVAIIKGFKKIMEEKTVTILEKTLERNGKIYFALDGIVDGKNGDVDFNKLLEVYDKNSKNYNSVTSSELRVAFDKYLGNPNLKFFIQKQVIELPKDIKDKISEFAKQDKESNDKFAVLDGDNAFDLPKDNVERDNFTDKAGEDKIVPEHYEPLNTEPKSSSDEKIIIAGVTEDETNVDDLVTRLSQDKVDKNIAADPEFENLYEKMASNAEQLQIRREKLEALLDKQTEVNSKQLNKKDKNTLTSIEKQMGTLVGEMNQLKAEQQELVQQILDKEKNPTPKPAQEKNFKDKVRDFFTKKDKVKLDKKEYEKTENGFVRKEAEVKKQLDTVLNSGKDIPTEHLQDFVSKLLTNKESNAMGSDAVTIKNEKLNNKTQEDFDRLEKIYDKLPNNFETTRVQMNKELANNLVNDSRLTDLVFGGIDTPEAQRELVARYEKNPQEVLQSALDGNFMKDGAVTDSDLEELVGIVQDNRKPVFEKYTGTDFKPAKVETSELGNGGTAKYEQGKIKIDPDMANTLSKALDSVLHESTHLEQDLIRKDKDTKVDPSVQELYEINYSEGGYIKPTISKDSGDEYSAGDVVYNQGYKKQPIEAEAFNSMNGTQIVKESLDKLVAKLKKEQALEDFELKISNKSDSQEEIVVATTSGNNNITNKKVEKNNNNLESDIKDNTLGNLPLIYGTSGGREELAEAVKNSPNKNNIIADGYLNMLNKGGDFKNLNDFAEKVVTGTLTSADVDKIINYTDNSVNENSPYFEKDANKVSVDANKELLEALLKNPETTKVLKELYEANEALKKDIDDEDAQDKYDDALFDFFELKTNTVLEKTLEKNGQIYFSLNEIVMDDFKKVDFNKLLDVFNPMNPNYPSVTSGELRAALSKYLDNPNLKFLLDKQVIELPQDIKDKIKDIVKKNEIAKANNFSDSVTSSNSVKEQKNSVEDRFAILDKDNAFDFPKPNDSRNDVIDMVGEGKIVADHYQDLEGLPRRKSTRRESQISEPLRNTIIINGERVHREEGNTPRPDSYVDRRGRVRPDAEIGSPLKYSELVGIKNPIVIGSNGDRESFNGVSTDSFLTHLTSKENNEKLVELAKEASLKGTENLNLDLLLKNNDGSTPSTFEKDIINTALGTQLGAQGLSKIHQANSELKLNSNDSIAHEKLNEGLKELDLALSEAILDKTLEHGNNAYVSITDTVTDASGNINLDKIYDIFNPNSPNFNSKEANELRYILKKHSDNPNLKFTVGKQVIELPTNMKDILVSAATNKKVIVTDTANEPKIVAEHYEALEGLPRRLSTIRRRESVIGNPTKNSSNLEEARSSSGLGKTPIVFGNSSKQKELGVKDDAPNRNSLITDNYLSALNKGENREHLVDLAQKFVKGEIDSETIDNISNYKDGIVGGDIFAHPDTPENRVSSEANRELLEKVLGTQFGTQGLSKIAQATQELKNDPNNSISKEKLEEGFKEFDTAKSLTILKETLNGGNQAYISIKDIVQDGAGNIDLGKLKEIFDRDNPNYDSKEANELRYVFKEQSDNPNLKLFIDKQVVDIPKDMKEQLVSLANKKKVTINKKLEDSLVLSEKKKLKNNNNLESDVQDKSLGNTPIIYGTKNGRRELISAAESSPNKSASVADSYLGKLNMGMYYVELHDFAQKYTNKTLTDKDIQELASFKNPYLNESFNYIDNQVNKVDSEANKELLDELLKNKKVQESLETIAELGKEIMIRPNKENDKKYMEAVTTFMTEKTKTVLEKTFEGNGQVYFALDQVVSDREDNVDFNKLVDLYSSKNKNSNSITTNELKLVFEKYLDNPNLKFTLGKQVVEIPQDIKDKIKEKVAFEKKLELLAENNAFDFPKDDGVRDSFEDRANEPKIVAEHYEPLGAPPVRNNEEIKLSKYVNSKEFQQRLEGLKEKILEKYGTDRKDELDGALNLNDFRTKKEVEEYLRKVLAEENITLTGKELDNFLSKASDKFLKELDNGYNDFIKEKIEGDTVFRRSEEGVKKQLEIVAKDKNNIPPEHLQNFLANLFLNKDARTINESIRDKDITIIANKETDLDDDTNKNLYSIYEKIPNKFDGERKKLDNLIVAELGKSEVLTNLVTDDGYITPQDFRDAYRDGPQTVIDRVYNLDISNISQKDIEDVFDDIQNVREKYFEPTTGVKYEKSKLVLVDSLSDMNHEQAAFHDPKTNTIYVSEEKVTTLGKLVDILLHETQHNEQDLLSIDTTSDKVSPEVKELYAINGQGYINPQKENLGLLDTVMYRGQPVEKEAFEVMRGEEVIKDIIENYIKSDTTDDRFAVLDKDNAFDFPKDDGVRDSFEDRANESKIVAEHYEPLGAGRNDSLRKSIRKKAEKLFGKKEKVKVDKTEFVKSDNGYVRTEAEVKRQLDNVLNSEKNIPKEHLQDYVAKMLLNKETRDNFDEDSVLVKNEKISNESEEDDQRLEKIYSRLGNDFETTRKNINKELVESLSKDKSINDIILGKIANDPKAQKEFLESYGENPQKVLKDVMLGKYTKDQKITEETLLELSDAIQTARKPIFEKNTGVEFKPAYTKISNLGGGDVAQYMNKIVFADPKKSDTLVEAMDSLLHETTHLEQDLIRNSDSKNVSEEIKELYSINFDRGGYIKPGQDIDTHNRYKSQPTEAEAFESMTGKEIIKRALENYVKNNKDTVSNDDRFLSLSTQDRGKQEMYQPDDEQPGTSMDTTPAPPKELTANDIVNSPDFRYSVNKMIESLTQKYGVENARAIKEELNLDNPLIKERMKIDLENEMAQIKVPITDDVLSLFLNEMALKYIRLQKEKPDEYKLMNGFGGKVFVRTHDGMRKQLEIVAKHRDKIPPEHLQNFLANLFMNKEAKKVQENGIEGKTMVANDLRLNKTYIDDINLSAIYEMIPNKFAETRKEMDNLVVKELGNSEYLKNFITQGGAIKKEILKGAYSKNPNLLINTLFSISAKNVSNNDIELLLKEIDKARGKYFEEKTGLKYIPNKIKFVDNAKIKGQVADHNVATGTITIYKDSITTLGNLIDALLHESQHHEQGIIALDEEKGKVSDTTKELYDLGHYSYIDGKKPTEYSLNMYKLQPVEREAFEIMRTKEIIKSLIENIIKA